MSTKFPKPDRSNIVPNFQKTPENDMLDIGWNEGEMSDGRPYRFECWCQDQITCVTVLFSSDGLERLDDDNVSALLELEGIIESPFPRRLVSSQPFRDPSGNNLLSVNIVVADDDAQYAAGGPMLNAYPKDAGAGPS